MRVEHRHHRQPAAVRDSQHARAPVVVGDVLDQPGDRVVSIGALIDRFCIAFVARRPEHHELALGFVAPADVLKHENVTFGDEIFVAVRQQPVAAFIVGRPVRRARKKKRKAFARLLRNVDIGIQLHPVAHGNVDLHALESSIQIRLRRRRGSPEGDRSEQQSRAQPS